MTWRRTSPLRAGLLLVVGILAGGWLGASVVLATLAAVSAGFAPRRLLLVSAGLLVATPVVWLLGNAHRLGTIGFGLVTDNPAPQWCALSAVMLLMVGVFAEGDAPLDDKETTVE